MPDLYDRARAEALVWEAAGFVMDEDAIDAWLHTPAPIFDGRTAMELLSLGPEGRDRILAAIDALGEGVFL